MTFSATYALLKRLSPLSPWISLARRGQRRGKQEPEEFEDEDDYEYIEEGGGCSGCLWGIAGAIGCLSIPLVAFAVLIVLGLNTLDGITDSIREIFSPSEASYGVIDESIVLENIQTLSQLTTIRHTYSVFASFGRDDSILPDWLTEDVLNINIIGYVEAGIDLSQLTQQDITIENGVFTLRLPPPEIQDCIIDERRSAVNSRQTGWLVGPSPQLDIRARRYYARRIGTEAMNEGILDDANVQAQNTIGLFVSFLSLAENIEQVEILTTPPSPDTPLPDGCS